MWVKGKDVTFDKGTETTAYVSGDTQIDESRRGADFPVTSDTEADRRISPGVVLTNADIVHMQKAGLSEEIVLSKIAGSPANFNIDTQDLIRLKEAGVSDKCYQRNGSKDPVTTEL